MDWMTIAWPMVIGACLTLALINLRIALGDVRRAPHMFFFSSALAVAAVSVFELSVLRSNDLEHCRLLLRWASVPLALMVASVAGFVWSFFGTGRGWLALIGTSLCTVAQLQNLLAPQPVIRNPVALRQVESFGGVTLTVPVFESSGWAVVEIISVAIVILFVLDASIALWKKGGKRRAVVVGGSIVVFFLSSRGQAALVEEGLMQTPYFTSFAFLAVLVAMGHELSDEVFRAAKLSRDLHESERRMDLAAHAAKLGFWTWNLVTDDIWANETARRLFDVPSHEPVNSTRFFQIVHPEDREAVREAIGKAIQGGLDYEKEYRVVLRTGDERWIAARGRVELSSQDKPITMRGVLLDITAQKRSDVELMQLRGQLAHAGRVSMMGQLASALAHELNQPLGAILRNAEAAELFMQADQPNLEEVRAIIADIRKDDQRAGDVIDRLRALLKRRDIESHALSASHLLDEVHALTRADAAARGVKLVVHSPTDLPLVRGDRVHLQQVLINLIINAMDALGESPSIDRQVRVEAKPIGTDFVQVSVMDNGLGIPIEKLSHVFDPFFTTKPHGMGMGLPISRTIIEAHGGKISAANLTEGGAVFRFTLPVDPSKGS